MALHGLESALASEGHLSLPLDAGAAMTLFDARSGGWHSLVRAPQLCASWSVEEAVAWCVPLARCNMSQGYACDSLADAWTRALACVLRRDAAPDVRGIRMACVHHQTVDSCA